MHGEGARQISPENEWRASPAFGCPGADERARPEGRTQEMLVNFEVRTEDESRTEG